MHGQHGQNTDVLRREHKLSVDRAQTIGRQSMDDQRTEHECSADREQTFRGQSTDIPRTEQRRYTDTARAFCGSLCSYSANVELGTLGTWDAVHYSLPVVCWYWALGVHKLLSQGPNGTEGDLNS